MLNKEILESKGKMFKQEEGRASYYDLALEIVDDHPLHASIILLATWNVSRWRFMASDSNKLIELRDAFELCEPILNELKNFDIKTANLDQIKTPIITLYDVLSKIKGVEYTGASKVLHLRNRNLFVMWDDYIRAGYEIKEKNGANYFKFLKRMQSDFGSIEWEDPSITLAKAIDEYNYVEHTLPALRKLREKRQRNN